MDTLQTPLKDTLKSFLENQASKKGFGSPNEYLQSLLSDLQKQENAKKELEAILLEGLRSPSIEVDDAFWRDLKEEFLKKHPEAK